MEKLTKGKGLTRMNETKHQQKSISKVTEIPVNSIKKSQLSVIQYQYLHYDYSKTMYLYLNSIYATQSFVDDVGTLIFTLDEFERVVPLPSETSSEDIVNEIIPNIIQDLAPFFVGLYVDYIELDGKKSIRISFNHDYQTNRRFPEENSSKFILDSIKLIIDNQWLSQDEKVETIEKFIDTSKKVEAIN